MFDIYMASFLVCLITAGAMVFMIKQKAYTPDGKLTCSNYVYASYLYIVLSLLIIAMVILSIIFTKFYNTFIKFLLGLGNWGLLGFLIVLVIIQLGLYYLLRNTNPNNTVALHLIWLSILLLSSLTLGLFVLVGISNNTLLMALSLTILLTIITGYIGYTYGDKLLPFDFDKYLYGLLIILVVSMIIVPFFIKDNKTMGYLVYVFAAISLVIFVLLMLSYNNKIKERAEKCNEESNPPNYPYEAMGLVRKIIIVFQDLIVLLGRRRR